MKVQTTIDRALYEERIFTAAVKGMLVELTEACDYYYSILLTPIETREVAKWLNKLADEAEAN